MADGYALDTQQAVIGALKADAGVSALIGARVYDEPPQGVEFPYAQIGPMDVSPSDDMTAERSEVTFGVYVFSRPHAGRVEVSRAGSAIWAALHRKSDALTFFEFAPVYCFADAMVIRRGSDGETYEAVVSFRVLLQET